MPFPQVQSPPPGGVEALPDFYGGLLTEARERTLWLVAPVSDRDADRQHNSIASPLAWDLGHIAAFEDLWLCHRAGGLAPLRPDLWEVYDATETPRSDRGQLEFLPLREARAFMDEVRARTLEVLARANLSQSSDPLNARGFVWEMVLRHEHQHNETMLQGLQLAPAEIFVPERSPIAGLARGSRPEMVTVAAGPFLLGAGHDEFAYDNERALHEVELPAFAIDRTSVTVGQYLEWIEGGGYGRREHWSAEGWAWRRREDVERPLYLGADGQTRSFERVGTPRLAEPVMHVSWFEADAFARAHGKRLPTEAEWEKAATWDEAAGAKRTYPWGEAVPDPALANLDQTAFAPAPVGAHPKGASAYGVLGMVGDTWEWTASDFRAYPGFAAFPYREYSEIFFGAGYRVLRGGSWATRARTASTTFRNWDLPQRRQIFAGFRCVGEA